MKFKEVFIAAGFFLGTLGILLFVIADPLPAFIVLLLAAGVSWAGLFFRPINK